ncbi:MAG TPA: hypothetical protein PLR25_23660 [Planctomycetaceae bacterium]|nr:hypothetical protein [Planctomycetaceae bacterium]
MLASLLRWALPSAERRVYCTPVAPPTGFSPVAEQTQAAQEPGSDAGGWGLYLPSLLILFRSHSLGGYFSEIRCFEDVSIDATFLCRFRFADLKDVQRIIDLNKLRRIKTVRFLNQFWIAGAVYPDWYDLRSIPDDSPKYGCDYADDRSSMWLYIDVEEKVGYLEMLY